MRLDVTQLAQLAQINREIDERLNVPLLDRTEAYALVQEQVCVDALMGMKVQPGWKYASYRHLVKDLGTLKQSPIYVPDEPAELQDMEIQQCYFNAFVGATDLGFQYVEGYARTNHLTVQHAWLEDDEGRIIDPTWAHLDLPVQFPCTYHGIRFSTEFVQANALRTGWCSILQRDYDDDHAAVRYGFVTDEAGIVIAGGR